MAHVLSEPGVVIYRQHDHENGISCSRNVSRQKACQQVPDSSLYLLCHAALCRGRWVPALSTVGTPQNIHALTPNVPSHALFLGFMSGW
jgi:hypothetical protein